MNYSVLKKFLSKNYSRIQGKLKDYYLDKEGRVVATLEIKEDGTKLITTYIDDARGDLNSHYNKVAYSVCNKIDKPMVDILLGRNNDTDVVDGQINFCDNPELDTLTENYNKARIAQCNLGSIGTIKILNGRAKLYIGERCVEGMQTNSSQNGMPTHLRPIDSIKQKQKMPNNRN